MSNENKQCSAAAAKEEGLQKTLTTGQLTMIAIGGAIGTGLFMGSKFAIGFAGPSVIVSYAIGALIALIMMACLSEMTVANPTSGSFGVYAEEYINPWAGFVVRWSYWICIVIVIGAEVTAVGEYMSFWFPQVPGLFWILFFAIALIIVNATSVSNFGKFEFVFASIKVIAIVLFILVGCYVIFGNPANNPDISFSNFTNDGGFMPNGIGGIVIGIFAAIFSYFSMEMIAISAGEAKNPEVAVPRALRSAILRLFIFYICSLTIMLAMTPWKALLEGETSPFVRAFEMANIPFAAGIMNFVVLTAALSAMNSMLYISSRMLFSLSRSGFAPPSMGKLNKRCVPFRALIFSSLGIALAAIVNVTVPTDNQFLSMMGMSMFGPIFTWLMVMVTFLFFRKKWDAEGGRTLPIRVPLYPVTPWVGIILLGGVTIYASITAFKVTLYTGIPWFIFITIVYFVFFKRKEKERAEKMKNVE